MELSCMKSTMILFFTLYVLHVCIGRTHNGGTGQSRQNKDPAPESVMAVSLVTTLRLITEITNKSFTILGIEKNDETIKFLRNYTTGAYPSSCKETSSNTTEDISIRCKLDSNGNMITLKTVTEAPTYLYLAVHNQSMDIDDPLSSVETFCRAHFTSTKEPTTCPTTTIPTCPPCTSTRETEPTYLSHLTTTNDNKGTYDAAKGHCNQLTEKCILQIVIASIASFIAGIVVCLLVLCLLRHCRERLCVKTTTPDGSLSKSIKVKEPNEELKTPPQMKPVPEDRDLQAVNPEYIMDIGTVRPQQSAPKQVPLLEMSDKRRSDHIYSEIGNKQTNASNVYESTFQNRLSDHVYQGIPDNRLQTHKCTENRRIDETHTIDTMESGGMNAKLMSETDPCYTEGHDYFTLEKGSYSVNDQETGDETKSMKQVDVNPQPDPNGCYTQHHDYFILEKVNNAITEPGSSVDFKSNEPGNMNANAQLEPDGC